MNSPPGQRTRIFVSYSHEDRIWLKRLQTHIKPLMREGMVDFWDDTIIKPGSDWQTQIAEAIDSARISVLLISANFLASDFIASDELPKLLKRAEDDGAIILPVIISPSRFTRIPSLARFQAVNSPERPMVKMAKWEQEEVFVRLTDVLLQSGSSVASHGRATQKMAANREEDSSGPPRGTNKAGTGDVHNIPDKVRSLYNSLTPILGFLKESAWKQLSIGERDQFESYLINQLMNPQSADELSDAINVLNHSNQVLSQGGKRVISDCLVKLTSHRDPKIRERVAWQLRWRTEATQPDQPERALCDLLDDDEAAVVNAALGSLGFAVLRNNSPEPIARKILTKAEELLREGEEVERDGVLFLYASLLREGVTPADFAKLFPILVQSLHDNSYKVRERALWSIAEVSHKFTDEQWSIVLHEVDDLLSHADTRDRVRAIKFYEDTINPRYSWRFNRIAPDVARKIAAHILDRALEWLDEDMQDIRNAAWSLLGRIGGVVPRQEHGRVLERIIAVWEVDRSISVSYLAEVIQAYKGKVPERLAEQIETYRRQEAERELQRQRSIDE